MDLLPIESRGQSIDFSVWCPEAVRPVQQLDIKENTQAPRRGLVTALLVDVDMSGEWEAKYGVLSSLPLQIIIFMEYLSQ